ncbi:protein tyrosine phosphatase [Pseudoalteromonas sp. NEC-BIFX-2020_002]|uniref:protein-tyrosine phosphatase family protein n=1 Tax=Pseudoalteromonas sp. NEC-BIFX-2020_002 TaxID=2732353 RepID=UPI001476A411|nr:dual specificity protein phosphatase family protein [Pseudoalteromonas sp. NEC-BIFX-2020_002]NNG43967.1 protein tyrosine phosphatase [Pseudoalteromonas sp. NEC-BIFX-2020_002]
MLPTIYIVKEFSDGKLSVMAKPVSNEWIDDEFSGLKSLGVDTVVSLLEKNEEYEVGLTLEMSLCHKYGIEFISFPIPDRGLPNTSEAITLAEELYSDIINGKHVVIHCRAGIGRTGIIAGAVLVKFGVNANEALSLISDARGVKVPDTEEQENWLKGL